MKFTFKPFKAQKESSAGADSSEETQTRYHRRREQVRRAQKTHRERKEAYIKSLETEVVQLRANEARLFQETKALYAKLSAMKKLLATNGISVPLEQPQGVGDAGVDFSDQSSEELFEFNISKTTKHQQERIQVRRQSKRRGKGEAGTATASMKHFFLSQYPIVQETSDASLFNPTETIVSQSDPTAIGMDFILALEAPCLGHLPQDEQTSTLTSSGHALMASATLLHHHHISATDLGQVTTWTISESGVERLLELSKSIPLDGEVTPVQAWDHIRKHPQYEVLSYERLERLKSSLIQHVKCYGFGGVIAQDVFENALFDTFVVASVF
ncbi:hypothetical protein BU23DRAFT_461515 [Bimuria novae-zelandiae CBS 107.79]|uniref:BZIP domain-containing protein n=1 Tax=Bimuria novae-zelandiae CBS 107.79 TaxID=1447943 RepID=A0A6A5VDN1_9PLEO|nr:hypothetical protein BU23DRAFT_461515 [Bimuria novae-zelandiae CBS 107.79]